MATALSYYQPSLLYNQPQYYSRPKRPKRPKPPFPAHSNKADLVYQFTKQEVIPNFKGQSKGKQFALVNFWSTYDCMTHLESVDFYPSPQVDPSSPSMPQEWQYDNYIVARPKGRKHSEKIIMDELDSLYIAYLEENDDQIPACIFLYSWLMPCVKCTNLIIAKLSHPCFAGIPVVVAFTNRYKGESEALADINRERLLSENFEVYQVHPRGDTVTMY